MQFNPLPLSATSVTDLQTTMAQNLRLLSEVLNGFQTEVKLQVLTAPPEKPREGWLVRADGTAWNPGAGAGVYTYLGGAWVKL
jgi:hypothetical protein